MIRSEVLVNVIRGDIVECFHVGDAAVVDTTGKTLYYVGDPDKVTYMRSSAKPLQAIPYVEMGGPEKFGFTDAEVAVTCASHSGEEQHTEAVLSILKKIGFDESYLQCGTHMPVHQPTTRKMIAEGKKSTWVHSNCSGKHSGMLTLSRMLGSDPRDYLRLDGPVQSTILKTSAEMMGLDPAAIKIGIDGCGAPVFGVPLSAMALGFARISDPSGLTPIRAKAVHKISKCMRENPHMVAGTDRFNTRLLQVMGDRIVGKSGAEGVFCVGVVGKGIGIAMKVADGNGARGLEPALLDILRQMGIATNDDLEQLKSHYMPLVRNYRGDLCGKAVPAVCLKKV